MSEIKRSDVVEVDYSMNKTINHTETWHSDVKDVETIFKKFIIMNTGLDLSFNVVNVGEILPILLTGREEEEQLPVLKFPLFLNINDRVHCFVDLRHICKFKNEVNDIYETTSKKELLSLELNRLILAMRYYNDSNSFSSVSGVTARALTTWILTTMGSTLSLNVVEILKLDVLLSLYFHFTLNNQTGDRRDDIQLAVHKTTQNIKDTRYYMEEMLDDGEFPVRLSELVRLTSRISPKFKDFNTQTLFSIMSGTIYLPNGSFLIPSAMEYPPDMVSVVDAIFTQRINSKIRTHAKISKIPNISTLLMYVKKQQDVGLI